MQNLAVKNERPKLISAAYAELNRKMHEQPEYGIIGQRYAGIVRAMCQRYMTQDVLDYGCGKCTIEQALGFAISNYDPAIPGLDAIPHPHDLVVCTDVLEHIEPECLDAVLDDLRRVTVRGFMCAVTVVPAQKLLPDGTNPHRICEQWEWWFPKLDARWRMTDFQNAGKRFVFMGEPR